MSFLGKLFGGLASNNEEGAGGAAAVLTCACCGGEVDEKEMEDGRCEECFNSEYLGPKYCCGAIYEDGEDTCRSCGEPL